MEGLAVGLQRDFEEAIELIVGICLHQIPASITVGSALNNALKDNKRHFFASVALFSISTPLGVLIGAFLHRLNSLFSIVCNGISAGTFLYIACCEILVGEFEKKEERLPRILKLSSFCFGGLVIALLSLTHM